MTNQLIDLSVYDFSVMAGCAIFLDVVWNSLYRLRRAPVIWQALLLALAIPVDSP